MNIETFLFHIIYIGILHFIFDFIFQNDWMAQGKSKSNYPLTVHVLVYSIPWFLFGWKFWLFNMVAHWLIDYKTSRVSSYYFSKQNYHKAFTTIGLDQELHRICLYVSFYFIGVPIENIVYL